MYNKTKSILKAALLLSILFSVTACGGGGGGGGGSSSGGAAPAPNPGGGAAPAPAGPVTDNDNPPLNAQLDGDIITITFSTPGFNPIVYAYNNSGINSTTDTVSGDVIFAQYQSLGATRFNLSKSNVAAGPYYAYVLDITFSDGLNATFTGTYDADGFDNGNALVPVSGTITIAE